MMAIDGLFDAVKLMVGLILAYGAADGLDDPHCPPQATCVALAVFSEARGEPIAGQVAVAAVVLERGRDACSVISEPGQFAGIEDWPFPRDPMRIDPEAWGVAVGVAHSVMRGVKSQCPGSDHFHATSMLPSWARDEACIIGGHAFYRLGTPLASDS